MKHIPHLFLTGDWSGASISVNDSQRNHLSRVLRLSSGAAVSYTDGLGTIGEGVWTGSDLQRGAESTRPRPSRLVLAVAPPTRRDRSRFLVEKLAELGVESLVWLRTAWGDGRVPSVERQAAWAAGALEQSRGVWLMRTGARLLDFADLESPMVVCSPTGGAPNPQTRPRTVVIGPEGGLSPAEIPGGAEEVSLAETILRIETAAMAAAIIFR